THVETFDPKMTAPAEFRSVVGAVQTNLPGVEFGGIFSKIARVADKMAVVRSFAHRNSGHGGGTHWVMTGYHFPPADNGQAPIKAGRGRIRAPPRGRKYPATRPPHFRPPNRPPGRRPGLPRLALPPLRPRRQRPPQHEPAGHARAPRRAADPAALLRQP